MTPKFTISLFFLSTLSACIPSYSFEFEKNQDKYQEIVDDILEGRDTTSIAEPIWLYGIYSSAKKSEFNSIKKEFLPFLEERKISSIDNSFVGVVEFKSIIGGDSWRWNEHHLIYSESDYSINKKHHPGVTVNQLDSNWYEWTELNSLAN